MKRLTLIFIIFVIILFVALISIKIYLFVCDYFSIEDLPTGELQTVSPSPDGKSEVKLYIYSGGATNGYFMRGELVQKNKKKNIYWKPDEFRTEVLWEDNNTVVINGEKLDIRRDTYDWRKDKKFCESIVNQESIEISTK